MMPNTAISQRHEKKTLEPGIDVYDGEWFVIYETCEGPPESVANEPLQPRKA